MWIILALFFSTADAQRIYRSERIAPDYFEGPNLVYDCQGGHFVCAADSSLENCQRRRAKADEFDIKKWPCVSIKKTEDTIACHKVAAKLIDNPIAKDLCYRREFRHDLRKL